jgi:protein phosphatase
MEAAVRTLVDEANRAGGRDNITVLAFQLGDPARQPAGEEGATLIGSSAEAAGLTATEVKKRAAAEAARQRREALAARPRHRRLRKTLKILVPLLILAALVFGAWYGNRQVWFLGTDSGGRVALYRGVPYELPFGIKLYSQHYSIPIQTESLPGRRRDAVTGHDLRSRSDAVDLIEEIKRTQENAAVRAEASEPGGGGVEPAPPAETDAKTEAPAEAAAKQGTSAGKGKQAGK